LNMMYKLAIKFFLNKKHKNKNYVIGGKIV